MPGSDLADLMPVDKLDSSSSSSSSSSTCLPPNIRHSLLSDRAILAHREAGTIVIEPFLLENLSTSSYDVTLGPHYFRESEPEAGSGIFNPFSESHVRRVWGQARCAETHLEWATRTNSEKLEQVADDDRIIWIKPGETLLAHTNEFIGGVDTVTTMMKARSSLGRCFIELCKCAGWGDIGYCNRWTMEVTNNSRHFQIPLIVGRRVAQIVFFDTDGRRVLTEAEGGKSITASSSSSSSSSAAAAAAASALPQSGYELHGKYQSTLSLDQLKATWRPEDMLPKMFADREARRVTKTPSSSSSSSSSSSPS